MLYYCCIIIITITKYNVQFSGVLKCVTLMKDAYYVSLIVYQHIFCLLTGS